MIPSRYCPHKLIFKIDIMTNCCTNSACNQILTLGFMRKLSSGSTCYTLPTHPSLSACCDTIDGDGYAPTYGELNSGTYPKRVIDIQDAYNDVNGFVFAEPSEISGHDCCSGSTNDMLIPRSAVKYEYTRIVSVSADTADCEIGSCECEKTINWCGVYARGNCKCATMPIPEVAFICGEMTRYNTGAASSTTVSFDYSGRIFNDSGETYASTTIPQSAKTVTLTSYDKCSGSASTTVEVTKSKAEFSLQMLGIDGSEIPCTGASITGTVSSDCSLNFAYEIYTKTGNNVSFNTSGTTHDVEIKTPENNDGWDSIIISMVASGKVCGADVVLELRKEVPQEKCSTVVTLEGCDPFSHSIDFGNDVTVKTPTSDYY